MVSERFAGRLRELRTQAGLSQPELAKKAGMTKDGIAHLEQGRRSPSWETVLALCEALGVSCEAFTVEPADAPAPSRGRPRKDEGQAAGEEAKSEDGKRKRGE